MSCSCGSVSVRIYPPQPTNCPDGSTYTGQNINVTGEGVFSGLVGTDFQFYGVGNEDGTITVELDATNKVINLSLNAEILAGSFPDATTTSKGKVELATDAEAQAKTDTARVLTPSNLAALPASTIFAGLVELATNAETQAGSDTTRAVTSAGLKSVTDLLKTHKVATDATDRTNQTGAFDGQLMLQMDTNQLWAWDEGTGDWVQVDIPNVVNLSSANTLIKIDAASIATSNLLGTDGTTAGKPLAYPVSNFLSDFSTTTVWTIDNLTTRRSFDTTTVTLPQLAEAVGTLAEELTYLRRPLVNI